MVIPCMGHLLLATFLALALSAYADEQPCTLHHGGNYYDLNSLKARKDYEVDIEGGHKFYLNVCRGVTTDPWNTGVSDGDGNIAGLIRRDHGDFAIGIVNTTLEMVEGSLMIRQSNGSPCKNMDNVRGSSSTRFICDTSVFAAGKPAVIDKFPPNEDEACHYELEWKTHFACPTGERGFFSGLLISCVITAMIFVMLYMVASTLYNRFVLHLRGHELMPKFTLQHAQEILDMSYEVIHSVLDRFGVTSGSWRNRGRRDLNPTSHHWTSRQEERIVFAANPQEADLEDGLSTAPERELDTVNAACDPGGEDDTVRL
ncbi:mannose-6-phosphate receptor binding domain-containing protein [Scleroderma yunnanense]